MNANGVKKLAEDAYFVVDTLGYSNTIAPFDVTLATQTISAVFTEDIVLPEPTQQPTPDIRRDFTET